MLLSLNNGSKFLLKKGGNFIREIDNRNTGLAENLDLGLSGAVAAGNNGPGMAHAFAGRSGTAGDKTDDRF